MCMCFFFSSRRRHTRYWRDWSSDVCSSDLGWLTAPFAGGQHGRVPGANVLEADYLVVGAGAMGMAFTDALVEHADVRVVMRSEERRVGKSVDLGGRRIIKKKKHRK